MDAVEVIVGDDFARRRFEIVGQRDNVVAIYSFRNKAPTKVLRTVKPRVQAAQAKRTQALPIAFAQKTDLTIPEQIWFIASTQRQ